MSAGPGRRVRALAMTLKPAVLTALAYGLASALFTATSRDGGLLTPDATPDPVTVLAGLLALALRLTLWFVAVPSAGMRFASLLLRYAIHRFDGTDEDDPVTPAATPPHPPR